MTPGRAEARLRAVRAAMDEEGLDALVLRPSPDFRFLGGEESRGTPDGAAFLVVTRDTIAATADPAVLVPEGARRVGVDAEMRVRELFGLAIEAELVPASAVLAPLRLRKEPHEIAAIGRAALRAEEVLRQARELAWFGATERAMAATLRMLALESGCEEVLSLRVAAGEHTARPAHLPGARVINPGDALLVSLCGRWDGYCAEVARVFAVAEPPEDFEAMYSVVLAAHGAALAAARPPAPAADVARAVGEVIDGSGYGRFAAARTGRGVGLGPDEGPRLSEGTPLAPGMTFCLEPAIYVPELFGARVADVVACTDTGPVVLTSGPPALHVLER
ncbi:aminopeptidase P family protein [Nonomuraea turkmeniaca]|uniref:Aminopeptidase P family protein n=1 Tax=Nonomuraea turkmeniaca TaxID=103838 RepID=A0A5S4FT64_9ACTN|nr:M24 family metallopeptidase [Nonomuraea turkmeniaca]TMR23812.1 aminopeptidase P family protein [Nonomuraea turkmeniaca]